MKNTHLTYKGFIATNFLKVEVERSFKKVEVERYKHSGYCG